MGGSLPRSSAPLLRLFLPLLAGLAPALAGCQAPHKGRDLALDGKSYAGTGYRAGARPELAVWVAPVEDAREPPAPEPGRLRDHILDHHWQRPVPLMVREVLVEELRDSRLFRRVVEDEAAADVVVRPRLLALDGSVEEMLAGRRARGVATLQVTVLGPRGADGQRPVLRQRAYHGGEMLQEGLGFAVDPFALAGRSLRRSLSQMLADLDAEGVGRRGAAAEAAAGR